MKDFLALTARLTGFGTKPSFANPLGNGSFANLDGGKPPSQRLDALVSFTPSNTGYLAASKWSRTHTRSAANRGCWHGSRVRRMRP